MLVVEKRNPDVSIFYHIIEILSAAHASSIIASLIQSLGARAALLHS